MSISLLQKVTATISGALVNTVAISTAPGSTLMAAISVVSTATPPLHLAGAPSGVTDSAGDTWQYSSVITNQDPPANGQYASDYYYCAGACAIGAAAVTSVSVDVIGTVPSNIAVHSVTIYEFTGMPTGTAIDAAASSGTTGSGLSFTTPSATLAFNGDAVIAVIAPVGSFTAAAGPFTFDSVGGFSAYAMNTGPGALACTFTGSSSSTVYASGILAAGAHIETHTNLIVPNPQAVRRAANW